MQGDFQVDRSKIEQRMCEKTIEVSIEFIILIMSRSDCFLSSLSNVDCFLTWGHREEDGGG